MSTEKKPAKRIPIVGLVLGLILVPIGYSFYWLDFVKQGTALFTNDPAAILTFPLGIFFLFMIVSWLYAKVTGRGLLALDDYVVASTLMMMGLGSAMFMIQISGQVFLAPAAFRHIIDNGWVPSYWCAPTAAANNLLMKLGIDWGAFAVPFVYWSLIEISAMLVVTSLPMIFLEQWTKVESLQFPLQSTLLQTLETDENKKPKFLSNRLFWVGFVVAMLLTGSRLIQMFDPTFPGITFPSWDPIDVLKTPAPITTDLYPLALLILFPTKVTLTAALAIFLQWYMIPFVSQSIGLIPDLSPQGDWTVMWSFWGRSDIVPFRWIPLGAGMVFAIALFSVYLGRKQIKQVFSEAIHNPSAQPWVITLVVGAVMLFILEIIPGVDVLFTAVGIIWMMGAWLGFSKASAQAPVYLNNFFGVGFFSTLDYLNNTGARTANPGLAWKTWTFESHVNGFPPGANQSVNFTTISLQSGYSALKTDLSTHSIFYLTLIGGILGTIIGWPLFTWLINTFGPTDYFHWWYTRWIDSSLQTGVWGGVSRSATWGNILWIFIGIAFGLILEFLTMAYAWWPLNTATWAFTVIVVTVPGIILQAVVAFAIRYLLTRAYGPKKANDYIVPLAVGYLAWIAFMTAILWTPALLASGKFPV